jgi:predicted permease
MWTSIRALFWCLINTTRRRKLEKYLNSELEFHLDMEIEEYLRQGMSPEEARRRALIALGGVDQTREAYREIRSIRWLELPLRDLWDGWRMLIRQPLQSMIIAGVLALGMAGTMTVFNLINGLILRPLPVRDQLRLMILSEIDPATGNGQAVPYERFLAWRQYNQSFESMAFSSQFRVNISSGEIAESADVRLVTPEYFDVLGIHPVQGRTFTAEESKKDPKPVLLGESLWKRMFNGDPSILGKTVLLDGHPSGPVVGILPDNTFPDRKGVWLPLGPDPQSNYGLGPITVGYLKNGISVEQAKADLTRIQKSWIEQHPAMNVTFLPRVISLRDEYLGPMEQTRFILFVTFAVAALVLVIACCNVAGTLLARGTYQSRELAIRATLGASRGLIMRQVLAESLVLVITGILPGIFIGWCALQTLLRFLGDEIPVWMKFTTDIRCILFCILLVAGTTVLCGLLPAFHAAAIKNLQGSLQSSGTHAAGSRGKHRTLDVIITAQVALAMALLVGAGLILRTYLKVHFIDPGFRTSGVLTYNVPLSIMSYLDENKRRAFWEQHIAKVRTLPGVMHAALAGALPLSFPEIGRVEAENRLSVSSGENPQVFVRRITPDYFATLDIPVLLGRDFTDRDNHRDSERTAIVDQSFVRQFWPGENPIDKRIRVHDSMNRIGIRAQDSGEWIRIIGVVQDVKQVNLEERWMSGIYLLQATDAAFSMYAVVHTSIEPLALVSGLRKSVQSLDVGIPVNEIDTLDNHVHKTMLSRRLALWMYGIPALVAVILVFAGIYGVTSYAVSQRTQEIGIRMALGAQRPEVLSMVVGHALKLVLTGLVLGLLGAFALGRILASMQTMIRDVSSYDPLTIACVSLFLTATAILACLNPARKAIKVDPIAALRHE